VETDQINLLSDIVHRSWYTIYHWQISSIHQYLQPTGRWELRLLYCDGKVIEITKHEKFKKCT